MRSKTTQFFRSATAMLLAFCMVLAIAPVNAFAVENKIVYTSIGDSMTNGYCLDGYDGSSGAINYGIETYANELAAWLAGYEGSVKDDQVIFDGEKATVDHRPLALSGMRAEDIHWIMTLDYTDENLMKEIYEKDCNITSWNESWWYGKWSAGDYRTWADFCDSDFRYADAAAKLLAVYNTEGNKSYFTSSYADASAISKAQSGLKADAYFPESRSQADSIGGYKYLQIATEYYQKSMIDADVISLAVGNTNFGTHMLEKIMNVVMKNDMTFGNYYNYSKLEANIAGNAYVKSKVDAMLASNEYKAILAGCKELAGTDAAKQAEIEKIVKYAVVSFINGYIGMLDAILALNPDAHIIQVALMNAYEEKNGTVADGTLGKLVEVIYTPMNNFLRTLSTESRYATYKDAKFYFAEAPHVSCMVDVYGDDFYMKDGQYVDYKDKVYDGTKGYTANTESIVRARFVEEIVCGDQIFKAMEKNQPKTQENIQKFLKGMIEYDMMTYEQKAAFGAQNSDLATDYALYLGFENAIIRSSTENITMSSIAKLGNISSAFQTYYPEVQAAISTARVDYLDPAAKFVQTQTDGMMTADQIAKACKDADYKTLLPYEIVAEGVKAEVPMEEAKGLITGSVVKRLCDAPDFRSEVYNVIADMSGVVTDGQYILSAAQVKTLAEDPDGVFVLAAEFSGLGVDAETVKFLYNKGLLSDYEDEIQLLMNLKDAINGLCAKEAEIKASVTKAQAGVDAAVSGASDLAYLLAVPQTMADKLVAHPDMQGALCMNGRVLLGTGAGGHPSTAGHDALYDAIMKTSFKDKWHIHKMDTAWTWAEDGSKAVLEEKCTFDGCTYVAASAEADITAETTNATCEEDAYTVYTATAEIKNNTYTDTKTITAEKTSLGHDYKAEWTWNAENEATLTLTCQNDEKHVVTPGVTVTEQPTAGTCTTAGKVLYTATAEYDGVCYENSKEVDGVVLGHAYGEPEWKWSEDYSTAVVTFTCTRNCGHVETPEATVTSVAKGATCEEDAYTVYTAIVEFENNSYTESKTVTVEGSATNHDYKAEWTWNAENEATLTLTCQNDEMHVVTPEVTVTADTTADTCTTAGKVVYTATAEYKEVKYEDTKVVSGAVLGHVYGEPEWKWSEDYSTAVVTFTCTRNCGHVETPEVTVTADTTAATCKEAGETVYTATAVFEENTVIDTKSVIIPVLEHTYEDGVCTGCGQPNPDSIPDPEGDCNITVDAELTSGATLTLSLNKKAVGTFVFEQTNTGWTIKVASNARAAGQYLAIENGNLVYSDNVFNWNYKDGKFSAEVKTSSSNGLSGWLGNLLGGIFGSKATTYYLVSDADGIAISKDSANANATFSKTETVAGHIYDEGEVIAPTCTEGGYTLFTCTGCGETVKMRETEKLGHNYKEEVVAPTCTKGGYTKHTCEVCGDNYSDNETEKLGHNFEEGVCTRCSEKEETTPDVEEVEVNVAVTVTKETEESDNWFNKLFGGIFGKNKKTTYKATINVTTEGTEVKKVEYSTDGKNWKEGTSFTSDNNITKFYIRVTGTNDVVYNFIYAEGEVTEGTAGGTTPDVPVEPEKPETPETPETPEKPETPETPEEDNTNNNFFGSLFDKIFGGWFK